LRYQSNFAAGKNKALNGDYSIWQRGTSISLPNAFGYTYTADRWVAFSDTGASAVVSRQTFTPGTAPVAGYEGQFFLRYYTANTGVGHILGQRIENVQTFAGQTVTVSFWAKAASALNFTGYCSLVQDFGAGGSGIVATDATPLGSITTSWQRFTKTLTVPSISGKTIGTSSFLNFQIGAAGNNTLDIWGAQIEAGSVATAFQTATGTIQGELSAAQRYYYRANWDAKAAYPVFAQGGGYSTTSARLTMPFPVNMRVQPTAIESSALANLRVQSFSDGTSIAPSSISLDGNFTTTTMGFINAGVASGLTANALYYLRGEGSTAYYIGWSAEL
jgi:hypothetical protein